MMRRYWLKRVKEHHSSCMVAEHVSVPRQLLDPSLVLAMSGAFTALMGTEAMVDQLNAMREELIQRFKSNEDEHERLRASTESVITRLATLAGAFRQSS